MAAPLIAAALSSIAPALAKQGLDLLSGVFRGAVNKGTKEVAELIEEKTGIDINDVADNRLTDAQWGQLKEFEFQYQSQLLQARQQQDANELERERLSHADRADARSLQKEALKSDDMVVRRFIYFFAIGLTIVTFLFIFCVVFLTNNATDQQWRVIDTVLGFLLGTSLSAVIQYFFGSSIGSKAKDEKLTNIAQNARADLIAAREGSQP